MPRQISQKCLLCARLSREQAIERHGNTCWDDKLCPSRRWRYANREQINAQRQRQYAENRIADAQQQGVITEVEALELMVGLQTASALVQTYRENAQSPVHAVIVELWVDGRLRAQFPSHTIGLTTKQINLFLADVLRYINQKYHLNLTAYTANIDFKPIRCPIKPCPFDPKLVEESPHASA